MLYLKKLSSFLSLKYNELKHRVFRISASTISGILNEANLKPYRIRYYLEKRNENFEEKMRPVLIAYKKVQLKLEKKLQDECITISYDEKPGINLENGEVISIVRDRHTNDEFIEWLKIVDEKYGKSKRIIVVLDNHSVHRSAKTKEFLETRKERFEFVFTPKHGSWLNIVLVFEEDSELPTVTEATK